MHAIGGFDDGLTGLKHGVVNELTSIECYKNILRQMVIVAQFFRQKL